MNLNKIKLFTFLFIFHNTSIIADYKETENVGENLLKTILSPLLMKLRRLQFENLPNRIMTMLAATLKAIMSSVPSRI